MIVVVTYRVDLRTITTPKLVVPTFNVATTLFVAVSITDSVLTLFLKYAYGSALAMLKAPL